MQNSWDNLDEELITCRRCPRLVAWREEVAHKKRRAYQTCDYWGKPVPGFGDKDGRLMLVGLAPGAHGSNRTGRMFTGDSSGDTLFAALHRAGFANKPTGRSREDGLVLTDVFITAIGRCAPPQNKPTAAELQNCRPFLERELALMPQLQVVMALGQMAFDACIRLFRDDGYDVPRQKFKHGGQIYLHGQGERHSKYLLGCYHPSRQNTQTGRLTPAMMDDVFNLAATLLSG